MNTEREQKTKNRLKPTIKNFIEDNAIKQDHKIDLQNYKKKNKNTKKTSKKDPKNLNKSIIDYGDDDSVSFYGTIPENSDENEACEEKVSNIKKDFPNLKYNHINISEKLKLSNEINFSIDNSINNYENKKAKEDNPKAVKKVSKKYITDAQTNIKTFPLNMDTTKKEDNLLNLICENVYNKLFNATIEKPKTRSFINKKKKRNNEIYIPLPQTRILLAMKV